MKKVNKHFTQYILKLTKTKLFIVLEDIAVNHEESLEQNLLPTT